MTKRKTLEELLSDCERVHGDKYDYSLVTEYKNNHTKIPVICRKHNKVFYIQPNNHILQKQGCPICSNERRRLSNTGNYRKRTKLVWGVAVNDYDKNIKYNKVHITSYHTWEAMLKRCYSEKFHIKNPTYKDCRVCKEWLSFTAFKKWFDENYVDGYALDKDILIKGNRIYSPDTCCFVPIEINSLLVKGDKSRGSSPIGTYKRENGRYHAYYSNRAKILNLGTFNTVEEAFDAYKKAKEAYIKDIATEYYTAGKITEKVYQALMKYEVEITD